MLIRYLREERFAVKEFIARHAAGILLALALTTVTAVSVKPSMRVLSDETNLASVTRSMLFSKTTENVTRGFHYYDNFQRMPDWPMAIEKRPYLLSYLAQAPNAMLGYDAGHIYLTNLSLFFLTLFCVYLLLVPFLGKIWVYSAMICVAAQPIIAMCATSGGYDLCAAFFLILSFLALAKFLEAPQAKHRFEFLWLSLVALVHSRPDSPVYAATLGFFLALFGYFGKERLGSLWILLLTPLLVLPSVWQRVIVKNYYEVSEAQAPFTFSHFLNHNAAFFKSLVNFEMEFATLPYATAVNLLGTLALLGAVYALASNSRLRANLFARKEAKVFTIAASVVLAEKWVITTSYFRGDPVHPADARYYVLPVALLSIAAVAMIHAVAGRRVGKTALLLSIFAFVVYHPIAIVDQFSVSLLLPRKYAYTVDFLKKHAAKNSLIIVDRPGQYLIFKYGAITFADANVRAQMILNNLERYLYADIYVIQEISYEDGQPFPSNRLDPAYPLRPLASLQISPTAFVRISVVQLGGSAKTSAFIPPSSPPVKSKPSLEESIFARYLF